MRPMKAYSSNGAPPGDKQSVGLRGQATWRPRGLILTACLGALGALQGAEADYYLHAPGCVWGALIETNISATSIAAIPGGYVVSGTIRALEPDPGVDWWGFVAELDHETGAVRSSTDFRGDPDPTRAEVLVPLRTEEGDVEGFALVGAKSHFITNPDDPRQEWYLPWLWLVRLDTGLERQQEAVYGKMGHDIVGRAVVTESGAFVIGAVDSWVPGGSVGWLGRFAESGELVGEPLTPIGCEGVYAVEPAMDGGYVVGTDCGLLKVSASLAVEWTADPRVGASPVWNRYNALKRAVDGSFVGVGSRLRHTAGVPLYEGMVLTKVTAGGEIVWQRLETNVIGNDLLVLADGSVLVAGTHPAGRNGGADAWLLQTAPDGATVWQKFMGTESDEAARALAVASEGEGYVLLGEARVSDVARMWVSRLQSGLQPPVPTFTFSPAELIFVDQDVTFNASASSAPGSSIATWEWDFGDGTGGTGVVVTHRFRDRGPCRVTLTVVNQAGLVVSTSQEVVITGLQMQWERLFGGDFVDSAVSIVEARDGGFVLCGSQFKRSLNRGGVWVLKTDRHGRFLWEKMFSAPIGGGTVIEGQTVLRGEDEDGHCIIRAHDTGYVIAGDFTVLMKESLARFNCMWLVKIDESGELVWPTRIFGEPFRDETAWCVAATPDGGYIVAGGQDAPGTDLMNGWLVKTDAQGNEEWNHRLASDYRYGLRWVTPAPDGGYWTTGGSGWGANSEPGWVFRTGSDGIPTWTNVTAGASSAGGTYWIDATSEGGCVVVGTTHSDMGMFRYDPDGELLWTKTWEASPAVTRRDIPYGCVRTLDGGYLMVGSMDVPEPSGFYGSEEVAIVKTGPDGETHWIELLPGTYDHNERAYSALALDDGSYVILARKDPDTEPFSNTPVWLFRLAANAPPEPHLQCSPPTALPGMVVQFSGALSTDRDGSVVLQEWTFGDGGTATGTVAEHVYTNAGPFQATLTVIDNDGGERTATNVMHIVGVIALTSGVEIETADVTTDPAGDPTHYPRDDAPPGIDWTTACAFQLAVSGPNGTCRFRIVFPESFPPGAILYKLPDWEEVTYTVVDAHTIEVSLSITGGVLDPAFVLARALPACTVTSVGLTGTDRLSLSFTTEAGLRYLVHRSPRLVSADWQAVPAARTPTGAVEIEPLTGTGAPATLFVERGATGEAYLRIAVER